MNSRFHVYALSVAALMACRASPDASLTAPPCVAVSQITVSPADLRLSVGDTLRAHATVADPCWRASLDLTLLRWATADTTIAVVEAPTGLLHARSAGSTTLRATLGSLVGAATLLVVSPNSQ